MWLLNERKYAGAKRLRIWECGLRIVEFKFSFDLHFIIFNPKSKIQNHKSYGGGPLILSVGGDK